MIKKPNFFIIGAPKCGTTALSEYLRSHPDIFFSIPKEPDYFNYDIPSKKVYQYTSLEDYLEKCFSGSASYKRVGEGSVRYLFSTVAVDEILKLDPEAKLIVMLRNPVDLCHSLYHQHLRSKNEDAPSFEEAWSLQESRRNGGHIPETCAHPILLQYSMRCMLGDQIERLFAKAPDHANIKIISFNEFTRHTKKVYEEILLFLGLQSDGRKDFPVINEYTKVRSHALERLLQLREHILVGKISKKVKTFLGLANWPFAVWVTKKNYRKLSKIPLSPEFRNILTEHFRSDVEKVKKLTGIDLYEK